VETAGAVAAAELATRLVRPGGRVVLLGIAGDGKTLELPTNRLVWGDIALIGSFSYSTSEWTRVVGLLERRLVDLDPIVTHRFPARRFEDAFAPMDDRHGVVAKVLVEHPT
jgi:L-iditol 2-dehydrogenase